MNMVNLILVYNTKRSLHNSTTVVRLGRKFHNGKRLIKKGMEKLAKTPIDNIELKVLDNVDSIIKIKPVKTSWMMSKEARQTYTNKSWVVKK
tara:strand:- start:816 stop:1091 length:276 start_codon:yes stop_codon:yes gene_type:complete